MNAQNHFGIIVVTSGGLVRWDVSTPLEMACRDVRLVNRDPEHTLL